MAKEMSDQDIAKQREQNAKPGFFLRAAIWILSRFPLTANKYQNWTVGRRILVGWILWIVCLPIIPLVVIVIWYVRDPEGFKKSPYSKALMGLFVLWLGAFGFVATNKPQLDANGKYSPIQTAPNGEVSGDVSKKPASSASQESKEKIASQEKSNDPADRTFENCTEAFEAGVFDIKRSSSSYENRLDRDNDGIACER